MLCPVCDLPLLIIDRNGVEIHQCNACNGLWLTSAELDEIIENEIAFYNDSFNADDLATNGSSSKAWKNGKETVWDDEWDDEDYHEDRSRNKERKRPRRSRKEAIDEMY